MSKVETEAVGRHERPRLVYTLAEDLPERRVQQCESLATSLANASGLVHATPTGMRKYPGLPVPLENLHPPLWVAEIVYFPIETELVKLARQKGCRVLDGGGMAVFQAVKAFELFTGIRPDAERMMQHFDSLRS